MIPPRTTPNGFSSAAKPIVAIWQEVHQCSENIIYLWLNRWFAELKDKKYFYTAYLALVTPLTKECNRKCLQHTN
jgi:hypothetical protein